jgi:hypothetical protein
LSHVLPVISHQSIRPLIGNAAYKTRISNMCISKIVVLEYMLDVINIVYMCELLTFVSQGSEAKFVLIRTVYIFV